MRSDHPSPASTTGLASVADIGGSHVTAASVELGPTPRIAQRVTASIDPHARRETLLETIVTTLSRVASGAGGCAVALPGPFDYQRGTGTFDGVAKLSALAGVDLRAELAERLHIRPDRVSFINDALAYGVGEWSVSDGHPVRFACFTLGTGVGSAFLDRGHPVESGPDVPPHGWVHLLSIDGSPLEDTVSTRALQRRYRELVGEDTSVKDIADRARHGEKDASLLLESSMTSLGAALAPWIERFGATEIVIGGSMARSWDLLEPGLRRGLGDSCGPDVILRPSELFEDAPLIGAAVRA